MLVVQARDLDQLDATLMDPLLAFSDGCVCVSGFAYLFHDEAKRDACYALLKDEALDAREEAEAGGHVL